MLAAAWLSGCTPAPAPRGQLLIWVDTTVPVPDFGDTIRIDVLAPSGQVTASRVVLVGDARALPFSFGVAGDSADPRQDATVRLRVRLYPAAAVRTALPFDGADAGASDPPLPYTIDRLATLHAPRDRVAAVTLVLAGECLGVPADVAADRTCLADTGVARDAGADEGIVLRDGTEAPATLAGTWADARVTHAPGPAWPGTAGGFDDEVEIPGGVFFLGDERLALGPCGVDDECVPAPVRLVRVSPFFLDRYEATVDRWRAAVAQGFVPPAGSWAAYAPATPYCTLGSGPDDATLPMRCTTPAGARAFCAFEGLQRGVAGDGERSLPTEAQWEFAASGRGQERFFAWGDSVIRDCNAVSYGRNPTTFELDSSEGECLSHGPGPLRVDRPTQDLSRDGVHDLSGNVPEIVLDRPEAYGRGCWSGSGILADPVCVASSFAPDESRLRGGTWFSAPDRLGVAQRGRATEQSATNGFRCARHVVPPVPRGAP